MAKREIPEINAGSMADIAFLLLIFFLVTTTMDKDKAYKKSIPKKLEVDSPPPPPIEKRNTFAIIANQNNQVMVKNRFPRVENLDDLSDHIIEFYTTNAENNDVTNAFPMYSKATMPQVKAEIATITEILEAEEAKEVPNEETIRIRTEQIAEWEKKKKALKMLGRPVLREPHPQANIRVEIKQKTNYATFSKIHSEIEEAMYEIRDASAKDIFGVSYGTILSKMETDLEDKESRKQFELLNILHPATIIEAAPTK